MKFHRNNAIGTVGENTLSSYVLHDLKHIFRPNGRHDIGIDGEIEILDTDRRSSGGLVKVQVKATESLKGKLSTTVPIDEDHLDYFSSMTLPVIFVLVDNETRRIFWKKIKNKEQYKTKRKGKGFSVPFDMTVDLMSLASRDHLQYLGDTTNAAKANEIMDAVHAKLDANSERRNRGHDALTEDGGAELIVDCESELTFAWTLLFHDDRSSEVIDRIVDKYHSSVDRIRREKYWMRDNGHFGLLEKVYEERKRMGLDF